MSVILLADAAALTLEQPTSQLTLTQPPLTAYFERRQVPGANHALDSAGRNMEYLGRLRQGQQFDAFQAFIHKKSGGQGSKWSASGKANLSSSFLDEFGEGNITGKVQEWTNSDELEPPQVSSQGGSFSYA